MEERERTHPMRKEAFESTKILTGQKEEEPKKTSIVEKEPEKKEVAQQPDRELKKPSASQRRKSELMSRLEGERPATKEEIEAEEGLMAEITGLIIEQTMTKIGYDFYEYFFLFWEAPQQVGIDDYNIFIFERASPMWGSWIWVVVNDSTIWDRVLKPRSTEIEDAAKEAIEVVKQYLVNYQQYEFESEDMIGTGI
jgi:curli production assembly/transport component CsgE